ncbi:MAG: VCBS repeat-containing protein [Planctomycetes bacterium]|nr:VCBS repeat-containing protein [Planctomycetota bacterium]
MSYSPFQTVRPSWIALASAAGLAVTVFVAAKPPPATTGPDRSLSARLHKTDLNYVESSIGITPPKWDGGRSEIEFADMNLDGHLDIVSIGDHGSPYINTDMHGVSVWFGDGTGRWQCRQVGTFGYGGVAVGDVNQDGLPDVGYGMHHNYSGADLGDQLLEVALGDGSGTAWTAWDNGLAEQGQSWGMFSTEFADFNIDGWLDVASVGFGSGNGLHVYTNNRDGSWNWTFASWDGNSSMDITAGDVNNDGYPDLATAIQNGTVWLNDSVGGFRLADANLPDPGSLGLRGPDLGDVNGDGFDDLSFSTNGGIQVWTWNNSAANWTNFSGNLPASGPFEATQLVDMNLDGRLDIAAFGDARFAVWLGNGNGDWNLAGTFTVDSPGSYVALRMADADHNGYPDIGIVSEEKVGGIFSYRNHLQFFKEDSVATSPWIDITGPTRHRTLILGSAVFFDWVAAVPPGITGTVDLELSLDGPAGPWTPLASNLLNNGRYQAVLDAPGASETAYLRATLRLDDGREVQDTHGPLTILIP